MTRTDIKTWEDVEKVLGREIIRPQGLLESKVVAGLIEVLALAECFNKLSGKKADWNNSSQNKYLSYYGFSGGRLVWGYWGCHCDCPAGVAFAKKEDLLYAQEIFKDSFLAFHMVNPT